MMKIDKTTKSDSLPIQTGFFGCEDDRCTLRRTIFYIYSILF